MWWMDETGAEGHDPIPVVATCGEAEVRVRMVVLLAVQIERVWLEIRFCQQQISEFR